MNGLGYTRVRHYGGGLNGWVQHGNALEAAPGGLAPVPAERAVAQAPTLRADAARRTRAVRMIAVVDRLGEQSLSSLVLIWLAIVVGCGAVYWAAGMAGSSALVAGGGPAPRDAHGLLTAMYFSFITAASVGYGDVVPTGWVRIVAVGEGIAALFLFGLLISKFVSRRQDQLIGEIHLTTFEDRLDRVRTSLHLVLTELHAIVASCERRDWPRDRLLARTESAAAVFTGQLRTVHSVLYRPVRVLEAEVLEAILAGLASGLQAFAELLDHLPAPEERPASLVRSLDSMARLAREICGDCVPHTYAPDVAAWMDRVQSLAGRLTAARPAGAGRA